MPRLKVNCQKQKTGKESMKMIIAHFKVNIIIACSKMNPAVTYEMDYYIFEQEIIFIVSRTENMHFDSLKFVYN